LSLLHDCARQIPTTKRSFSSVSRLIGNQIARCGDHASHDGKKHSNWRDLGAHLAELLVLAGRSRWRKGGDRVFLSLARHARKVTSVRDAQRDQIGMIDTKLFRDAVDLAFFSRRDRVVCRGQREQTPHQCKLLVVRGEG
jgi:hypothetical protein